MDEILRVTGLEKRLEDITLKNINILLKKGQIMGVVGENGAGKTTTIKMILNMIEKTAGEISVFGENHQTEEVSIKQRIGYVPAEDYFIANSTLKRHAETFEIFYKEWDKQLFDALCTSWKLPLRKKITYYSTGMKTKAMLALALAHKPKLLILDEPTSGLDPIARIEVLEVLKNFVREGERSVLFSTHITTDLDKIADCITIMHKGQVVEQLAMDEIKKKYVLVKGNMDELQAIQGEMIGQRNDGTKFEGLMLKSKASAIDCKPVYEPNVEKLLIYTIWRQKDEKVEAIIKSI